jgi:effector-binding domain-containing protein
MITDPTINERSEQPTLGIRAQVTMEEFGQGVIPQSFGELFGWLKHQGIAPAGPEFIRYHVIDMACNMEVEMGVPVPPGVAGEGRIVAGTLPAGRYASLLYTGDYGGLLEANGVLINWARDNGIAWDSHTDERGDHFAARLESYFNSPADEPDPAKLKTEVAIRLADA